MKTFLIELTHLKERSVMHIAAWGPLTMIASENANTGPIIKLLALISLAASLLHRMLYENALGYIIFCLGTKQASCCSMT